MRRHAAAGEYVYDGGGGTLSLTPGRFRIETVGANAHTCTLEGDWSGESGTVKDDSFPCTLKFIPRGDDVDVVMVTEDACRSYCGVRARFDGVFHKQVRECRPDAVKIIRTLFKKSYQRKKFAEAVSTLQPLLEKCERVMWRFDVMWVRNDLALAHHHAGDDAACLKTLEPLGALRDANSDEPGAVEPTFEEEWKKVSTATQTNAKLCGYASAGKR